MEATFNESFVKFIFFVVAFDFTIDLGSVFRKISYEQEGHYGGVGCGQLPLKIAKHISAPKLLRKLSLFFPATA